jgi:hypothetical protein
MNPDSDPAHFYTPYDVAKVYFFLIFIYLKFNSFRKVLGDAILTTSSDCLTSALEIYSAVQMNRDKIPGMDTIYQEMRAFFDKPKRKQAPKPQS